MTVHTQCMNLTLKFEISIENFILFVQTATTHLLTSQHTRAKVIIYQLHHKISDKWVLNASKQFSDSFSKCDL